MLRNMLKSKIHRAQVTDANLQYEGSITIDAHLMEAADILEYEMVHVLNVNTGARFETYAIEGPRGSGVVCINGAAARLASPGDTVIILTYTQMDEAKAKAHRPIKVYVNQDNQMTSVKGGREAPSTSSGQVLVEFSASGH